MSKTETGAIVYFDATASGPQILGLSSMCESSMRLTNVIPTYDTKGIIKRRDLYLGITEEMSKHINMVETILDEDRAIRRKQVKKPIMTSFYGSIKQPENLFGKDSHDLKCFWNAMEQMLPGPMQLMRDMQSCWNKDAYHHSWVMPNGANVRVAVLDKYNGNMSMQIDGKKVSIPFNTVINRPIPHGLSLAANITHSVDNYIKDLVVLEFKSKGKDILTIHDCFGVHPNNVALLMNSYRLALAKVYEQDVIQGIIRQISGDKEYEVAKIDYNPYMIEKILESKYALS